MFLLMYWATTPPMVTQKRLVMDNGTLRDHLTDVIEERNELLRKVKQLEATISVMQRTQETQSKIIHKLRAKRD